MPLGFPTPGCCGSCDGNGAPNAFVVSLQGYTGNYSSCNGSWKLYASAWDTGQCTYFLKVGPARPDPNGLVNTDCKTVLTDFRATILCQIKGSEITVEVIDGAPGGEPGGVSTISTFTGSIGATPTNCLNINQSLTLGSTVGGSGTPTCSVTAGGPGRHCIYFNGCLDSSGNGNTGSAGGAGGSTSPLSKLRQPGRTTNCRQGCLCGCVCDSRARPNTVTVQFENFSGGCPNPNPCTPYFSGTKFELPFTGLDGQGNCTYGLITNDLNYYVLAILGFPGEPSEQGVFARVEMRRDRSPNGTLEYAWEADHLEWQTGGYSWGGPGTFPCVGLGTSLSMVLDNGNLTDNSLDGGPCITTDLATTTCLLTTSADYTGLASVSCCCGGAPDGGRWQPNLFICIQSVDPACAALNLVLAELFYVGSSGALGVAKWTGDVVSGGTSVHLELVYSSGTGSWQGTISCNGGTAVPFSFASLNSSTTVSNGGCCTGTLTLTLSTQPQGPCKIQTCACPTDAPYQSGLPTAIDIDPGGLVRLISMVSAGTACVCNPGCLCDEDGSGTVWCYKCHPGQCTANYVPPDYSNYQSCFSVPIANACLTYYYAGAKWDDQCTVNNQLVAVAYLLPAVGGCTWNVQISLASQGPTTCDSVTYQSAIYTAAQLDALTTIPLTLTSNPTPRLPGCGAALPQTIDIELL